MGMTSRLMLLFILIRVIITSFLVFLDLPLCRVYPIELRELRFM